MTATIHKLSAGSGYDYLTRSVCCDDSTGRNGQGLASYYVEKGDVPGRFVGKGLAGIDGIFEGDAVTADHMKSLFGVGMHPLVIERNRVFDAMPLGQGPSVKERIAATYLGRQYPVIDDEASAFTIEVGRRYQVYNRMVGGHRDDAIPERIRAQIRTDVARDFFGREYGREPDGPRELAGFVAKNSRPRKNTVSGYDLAFSPVKSVSTLWAIADPHLAAQIERAHNEAVAEALDWLERRALFTRQGRNGVRQVDVTGLVATAFVHRDSRAGDPDLHTHVAIANKVQTLDGRWLAIDGRVLYKATVSVSETYNTALEKRLTQLLGVRFGERLNLDARKRPVREIDGVDPELNQRFSKRRVLIEQRRDQLAATFQHDHGRPPTPIEAIDLAQQATLETRQAKHEPRTLADQRAAWRAEAVEVLGSAEAIDRMVHTALSPTSQPTRGVDERWFEDTARSITQTLASRRAVWQCWHVYSEAQRRVREVEVTAAEVEKTVDRLTSLVLSQFSVSLARPTDPVREPDELRRRDGASVYSVAGSTLFTTNATLAAEQRLVDAAGRHDGRKVPQDAVGIALLECTANGVSLNPGQATLVGEMATSGARLQLAIAPAGSGKTTAMRALAAAWTQGGGTLIGLAPSAVAAAELGTQIDTSTTAGTRSTDTLAKLVHGITTGNLPAWADEIDADTLVVIDEAGMADTLSLDTAVSFALERGASVRLIGDDQQLAAIGAGGVLRDIRATHGALQLSELMRFRDVAEGSASLALREGRAEALGFYLDHHRVHVGDQATMAEAVFAAWAADVAAGLESLMLAPTRDLAADLNRRARAHRLITTGLAAGGPTVRLGDGNEASVGDVLITRSNDRSLRLSATDWVKNGDRWDIEAINQAGLGVRHRATGRRVFLPTRYVKASTDLGYACTVHTAQGVTADTTHGLVTGEESRQQLYTLATRGREANHLYLTVASDGDPHNLIHPDVLHPKTATEILEEILGRDGSPKSATTLQREALEPTQRLGEAVARYSDSVDLACQHSLDPLKVRGIEEGIEALHPGISAAAAWPGLRAHLLRLAVDGIDPLPVVKTAVRSAELGTALDPAAVLSWRLEAENPRSAGHGPLPWLPSIPDAVAAEETWAPYLHSQARLITDLTEAVRAESLNRTLSPTWAPAGVSLPAEVVADVEVWRAATGVAVDDGRPTGPRVFQPTAACWQRRLNRRVTGPESPAIKEWGALLAELHPNLAGDSYTPVLAQRLAAISRAGVNPTSLLKEANAGGHLPDDHPAAALWWRISGRLTPAVTTRIDRGDQITTSAWLPDLEELLGEHTTTRLRASSWWPALLAVVDQGLRRGWRLPDLLALEATNDLDDRVDLCQALLWRASVALADIPTLQPPPPEEDDAPPHDLCEGWQPPEAWNLPSTEATDAPAPGSAAAEQAPEASAAVLDGVDRRLLVIAMTRDLRVINPEQLATEADLRRTYQRAREWDHCPIGRNRMIEINAMTQAFFDHSYACSWAAPYLRARFGFDLAGHVHFQPGFAPAGWTRLIDHLRGSGFSDEEMLTAGVATTTRDGRLIDKFRDRITFPITNETGDILGFVARRHPDLRDTDPHAGPKYLNTSDTPLFHKGGQLFGVLPDLLHAGATPVVVEGPMDAIATTLATAGSHVGLAPLGTALTEDQAIQLARIFQASRRDPIVATDADPAGQTAAQRDFWILAGVGLEPGFASLPTGSDPASLLEHAGAAALAGALHTATPLATRLIRQCLQDRGGAELRRGLVRLLAASGPSVWDEALSDVARGLGASERELKAALLAKAIAWDADPRRAAERTLHEAPTSTSPQQAGAQEERWDAEARRLDARLPKDPSWPLLARLLDDIDRACYNVSSVLARVSGEDLGDQPVTELIDRITTDLDHIPSPVSQTLATARPEGSRASTKSVVAGTQSRGPSTSAPSAPGR